MDRVEIPRKAIYRLSLYQRCLGKLQEKGIETVSSSALAKAAGVNAAQLRKDLGYFGQFGTRGLGYAVEELRSAIREALGRTSFQPVVLVGAGNLGSALLRYQGFEKEGFEVIAAFDIVPEAVLQQGLGVAVRPVDWLMSLSRAGSLPALRMVMPNPAGVRNSRIYCPASSWSKK